VSTLANGLLVASEFMPHVESVSLGIWVASGSRAERAEEHGIAHLLEHMAFKGTQRRSARDIAEQIEAVGGEINASTGPETTAYYARVLKQDVPLALDILGDILLWSSFDETELKRERAVVLEEIAGVKDNPEDVMYDAAHEIAFPNQPLGRTILGTSRTVRKFRREHLIGFRDANYGAGRMILSAAGAVDHAVLLREAQRWLAELPETSGRAFEPAHYAGGYKSLRRPQEQSHILIGFRAPSYSDSRYFIGQTFSGLLGGGLSSRLFQELRERRGLCYAVYSSYWGFSDTGMLAIHAATRDSKAEALVKVVGEQLRALAEAGPDEEDVARAKANMRAGLLMSLESSGARAERLARHLHVFGKPQELDEIIARIDSVGREDVRLFAEDMLRGAAPTCVSVGPGVQVRGLRDMAGGSLAT
jgi:predicted Zn-dependent peptidase